MFDDRSAIEVLRRSLADPAGSFSIGVPAAVAEFMRDAGEPAETLAAGLGVATPRGAIRVTAREDVRPVAYEALSRRPDRWLHGLVFCLPEAAARMDGSRTLRALGPDREAIHAADRDARLFDLGVGAPQVDFCVRTDAPGLIEVLRRNCGRPLAEWPGEVMAALMETNPQRVVRSRLGRIEVTQPIPRDRTPTGPHTHLFPHLFPHLSPHLSPGRIGAGGLDRGRAYDPRLPVPEGWLPCLQLYPPHPSIGLLGDERPFDGVRHAAFQDLLAVWGPPDHAREKARAAAFEAGGAPESFMPRDTAPDTPEGRLGLRIALRQLRAIRGEDPRLAAWRQRFDPS